MPADAGVETEDARLSHAAFVELLGARIRTLTNYDIERLNEMLESAWLGTQLTWRATVTQRASDVPDDVLGAIPLVRLVDVTDYWNVINRPEDPWRDGIIAVFRSVAEEQKGYGIRPAAEPSRTRLWTAWSQASSRARGVYGAVFAVVLCGSIAIGFYEPFLGLAVAYAAAAYAAVGRFPMDAKTDDRPIEVRFVERLTDGIHALSHRDLATLIDDEIGASFQAPTASPMPLELALASLDWASFSTVAGIRATLHSLPDEWRARVRTTAAELVELERTQPTKRSYLSRLRSAPTEIRARVRVGIALYVVAFLVFVVGLFVIAGFGLLSEAFLGALFLISFLFVSGGVYTCQVPDSQRTEALGRIASELAAA
jgi:hypothetical protein